MRRKSKRGGARAGAGRPRTTGTGSIRPVSYKLSETDRARAVAAASEQNVTLGQYARRALLDLLDASHINRHGGD